MEEGEKTVCVELVGRWVARRSHVVDDDRLRHPLGLGHVHALAVERGAPAADRGAHLPKKRIMDDSQNELAADG